MLYLLFQLGGERYVVEAQRIVEILPLVEVRPVPQAPPGVAGVFNYRGAPLPLLDLSALALGKPSQLWFSTRIILVQGADHLFGLIIEHATETLRREPADFKVSPVATAKAPYLGGVATDERGLIQRIELDVLLSADLRDLLFAGSEKAAHVTT